MIAGLPKRHQNTILVANPERALERRNWILGQMLKMARLAKRNTTKRLLPHWLRLYQAKLDKNLPLFWKWPIASLVEQYGEAVINSGWRVNLPLIVKHKKLQKRH